MVKWQVMFTDWISSREDAIIQQKVLITIPIATYRSCDSANQRCHTLRSWCNSNMASASSLVAGSSDEPIRLMVSATHRSSSCRSAWNLCNVYAAARASLRRRASCCNERQFSWSSDSLLRIGADRSGCFCDRRRASPSCSYWNQMKCLQYNVFMQIFGLKWQFTVMNFHLYHLSITDIKMLDLHSWLLFYMGVKFGLSQWEGNIC